MLLLLILISGDVATGQCSSSGSSSSSRAVAITVLGHAYTVDVETNQLGFSIPGIEDRYWLTYY